MCNLLFRIRINYSRAHLLEVYWQVFSKDLPYTLCDVMLNSSRRLNVVTVVLDVVLFFETELGEMSLGFSN